MPTSVLMPSLSPTMEEGVLAKWLVKEGDQVKPGTLLCSVETDKTTVDYESFDEGYVRKIVIPDGTKAKVNQLIAVLADEKDEDIGSFLEKAQQKDQALLGGGAAGAAKSEAKPSQSAPKTETAQAQSSMGAKSSPRENTALAGTQNVSGGMSAPAQPRQNGDSRLRVSPLARKMAEDKGIPLEEIQGSGPMGRVVKKDVESYRPAPAAKNGSAPSKTEAPRQPLYGSLAPVAPTNDIALSQMRKTIGRRLLESTQGTPVFYVTIKILTDGLNELRSQLNKTPGYKISVNDLVVKGTAFALRRFPQVNSTFHGEYIRQHADIDICIAVSIEGGLITPIVRNVDQKGLGIISQEIKALAGKAKQGRLAPDEYQGGTFTVSNLGMYGVDEFTSIINPPQAAILAVSSIQSELYKEGDDIKERSFMKVTLSADHRVVDGALGAQFVAGLKEILENPACLML